jgi:hypothetical protein
MMTDRLVVVSLPVGARIGSSQKGALRFLTPAKGVGSRNRDRECCNE